MKKYILYAHDGSGNHGCEALVRSTVELIGSENNFVLVSTRPDDDKRYGIDKLCRIVKRELAGRADRYGLKFLKAYYKLKVEHDYSAMQLLEYASGMTAKKGDIALSIGGDVYCYGDWLVNKLIREHSALKSVKAKTVYWGCSIEPNLLEDAEIVDDIKRYDLITARETISYEALKKVNDNTVLVADTAFLLNKARVDLPKGIADADLVGINLSPLVQECEGEKGIVFKNYVWLISYILNFTDCNILLIPHVVWKKTDDRVALKELYDYFNRPDRIALIGDNNCEVLKGYISHCRFFIGARTHATIAAYSECIPTLVLGYSVKSKGIAKDLFGSYDNYVIAAQDLKNEEELKNAFVWLMNNETKIRNRLNSIMPAYKKRAAAGAEALKKLR